MTNPLDKIMEAKENKRDYTVSVNQATYDLVGEVAQETGNSRPAIIEAFCEIGYAEYSAQRKNKKKK